MTISMLAMIIVTTAAPASNSVSAELTNNTKITQTIEKAIAPQTSNFTISTENSNSSDDDDDDIETDDSSSTSLIQQQQANTAASILHCDVNEPTCKESNSSDPSLVHSGTENTITHFNHINGK